MIYSKINLLASKIASKKSIKKALTCVAFMGNRTLATDSFRAIEVSAEGEEHSPVLINAKTVKAFTSNPHIFAEVWKELPRVREEFPNIDEVFNRERKGKDITIRVNAEYLEELLNVMKHINPFKYVEITVSETPMLPILLKAEGALEKNNPHKQLKARALLMPMNK